ncbi:ATP-binding cassette subfamily C member 4 [Anabrus simplex]|uniref:ATP-binding cassette subfamily C member 4 n=1 Tax=Anabrus simplex TaxID=316456 RepID=UPI0035A2B27E
MTGMSQDKTEDTNPGTSANPLSKLFFWWTTSIYSKGLKRKLEESDLYSPVNINRAEILGENLELNWNNEVVWAKEKNKIPSLARVIIKTFWTHYLGYALIRTVDEIFISTAQPILLGLLLKELSLNQTHYSLQLWCYAAGLVVSYFLSSFIFHHSHNNAALVGMRIRVACSSLMYRKALRLSPQVLAQNTTGKVMNIMSNDMGRFDEPLLHLFAVWSLPIKLISSLFLLYWIIGISFISGVLLLLLLIFAVQAYLAELIKKLRQQCAMKSDERIRLMNEVINGIQLIKMYAWEKPFTSFINAVRMQEIEKIKWYTYTAFFFTTMLSLTERASLFVTLVTYTLLGYSFTVYQVYTVSRFIYLINYCLTVTYSSMVRTLAEADVAIARIQEFLLQDERVTVPRFCITNDGVLIEKGKAEWSSGVACLSDINLKVPRGHLCVITGPVGSGKSSLLHVMMGELPLTEGSASVSGRLSYSSQKPWVFNGTVLDNILFGLPFSADRYRQVINACALHEDIEGFPYGDRTLVGERGIALSGGQQARISLARAVYRDADVYLLDDPLSAVDSHVGKHLFEECIKMFLRDKTRVLVTHQVQYLQGSDKIVLLNNGFIEAQGSFEEIAHTGNYMKMFQRQNKPERHTAKSLLQTNSKSNIGTTHKQQDLPTDGTAHISCYWQYITAGNGFFFLLLVVFILLLCQISYSGMDYWLMYWTKVEEERKSTTDGPSIISSTQPEIFDVMTCLYIYGGIVAVTIGLNISRTTIFFKMCMKASIKLHSQMLSAVLSTTMGFFHLNSVGRILNRFSKDMGVIDEKIAFGTFLTITTYMQLLAVLIMVLLVDFWLSIPAIVVGGLFCLMTPVYIATARNLKRLEGTARSPLYSHLSDSMQGLITIRVSELQQKMSFEFDQHQNSHTSSFALLSICNRAFGLWLDCICNCFIAAVVFIPLVLGGRGTAEIALTITQVLLLTGTLQSGILQATETISYMASVERVLEYTKLEPENALTSGESKPPYEWPMNGSISFEGVSLWYNNNSPPVLKDVSFVIQAKQKIGIIGHTGVGKSSLIAALFRLAHVKGSITIDNVNTSCISLHDLRRNISIIPQQPVLFSASLRYNLDPFNNFSDEELWAAIEEVELKDAISALDQPLSEGGGNLSVGQRQLVCLARAILKSSKILVLDEATANLDPETDVLIQATIRKKFSNCTVLTVAHRLNSIIDSDMVLAMDAGKVIEYDHPYVLLQNTNGYFYNLVQETGPAMSQYLTDMAVKAYETHLEENNQ